LELGKGKEYFVPVLTANADEPFLLELRYTVPGDGSRLELPVFSEEAAVQKVYLCVYLPATLAPWGSGGPWNEEFQWRLGPGLKWEPWYDTAKEAGDDKTLLAALVQGTGAPESAAASFLPDGRRYVFSALRPADDGALRLHLVSDRGLSAMVFLVVVLGGVVLLPARLGLRAVFVGAGIIALVLAGVFWPMFSMQILNGVLAAALFIVLVMWSVAYLAWTRPVVLARRRAAAAATPAAPLPKALAAALDAGLPEPATAEPPAQESPPPAPPALPEQAPKPESEGGPSHA
jgi:hypothetical protein